VLFGFLCAALAGASTAAVSSPTDDQLHELRIRIDQLENQLGSLAAEEVSAVEERRRLDAELELADAKVREVEILLEQSQQEPCSARRPWPSERSSKNAGSSSIATSKSWRFWEAPVRCSCFSTPIRAEISRRPSERLPS
jgi:hypothetical protein